MPEMVELYIANVVEEDHFLVSMVELSCFDVRLNQHITGSVVMFGPGITAILRLLLSIDLIVSH